MLAFFAFRAAECNTPRAKRHHYLRCSRLSQAEEARVLGSLRVLHYADAGMLARLPRAKFEHQSKHPQILSRVCGGKVTLSAVEE